MVGDGTDPESRYYIKAVERACDVLDHLRGAPEGASLPEVARAVGMPKSTAFRYLVTLKARGYVQHDPRTSMYWTGAQVHFYDLELLRTIARPHLAALREELGETVSLGVVDGRHVVHLDVLQGEQAVRVHIRPGRRDPLHTSALGMALLSQLSDAEGRSLLAMSGMGGIADGVLREVRAVRTTGWAFVPDEAAAGVNALSVPLPVEGAAAIGVSAPADRLPAASAPAVARVLTAAVERLLPLLRGTADS